MAITACGASQPSSAVEDDTNAPTTSAATPSPAPSASAETPSAEVTEPPATPVAVKGPPPKPGNPTFKLVKETPGAGGTATQEYRITWTAPKGVADSFLVYGLPDCLRDEKKFDGKPCVVRGMKIPADKLVLLGVAPGDERSMTVSWDIGEVGTRALLGDPDPGDQREGRQHLHDRQELRRLLRLRVLSGRRALSR